MIAKIYLEQHKNFCVISQSVSFCSTQLVVLHKKYVVKYLAKPQNEASNINYLFCSRHICIHTNSQPRKHVSILWALTHRCQGRTRWRCRRWRRGSRRSSREPGRGGRSGTGSHYDHQHHHHHHHYHHPHLAVFPGDTLHPTLLQGEDVVDNVDVTEAISTRHAHIVASHGWLRLLREIIIIIIIIIFTRYSDSCEKLSSFQSKHLVV